MFNVFNEAGKPTTSLAKYSVEFEDFTESQRPYQRPFLRLFHVTRGNICGRSKLWIESQNFHKITNPSFYEQELPQDHKPIILWTRNFHKITNPSFYEQETSTRSQTHHFMNKNFHKITNPSFYEQETV